MHMDSEGACQQAGCMSHQLPQDNLENLTFALHLKCMHVTKLLAMTSGHCGYAKVLY